MNGAPAGGGGGPPASSSAQPPPPVSNAVGGGEPRPAWLNPDLVSALRPSFYPSTTFPSTTSAASSAFLHPHQPSPAGPLPSLPSPYHQLYGPLSAAANYHAAAAAISAGHRPFLDPAAFLSPRYRYLLPSTSSRFPFQPGQGSGGGGGGGSSTAAERSLSESEGLGPGRPAQPWRRPLSPAAHKAPPSTAAPAAPPEQRHLRPPFPPDHQDPARFRTPSGMGSSGGLGGGPTLPTQPYYPSHFMRGTVIQLASGELKRVEELNTEDFVRSANMSSALKMDSSTVVRVEAKTKDTVLLCFSVGENKVQVSVEATVEHPFFVIGQGWSSCSPERTRVLYGFSSFPPYPPWESETPLPGLPCQRLQVGDICISLTHRDAGSASVAASLRKLKSPKREPPAPPTVPSAPPAPVIARAQRQPRHPHALKRPASHGTIVAVAAPPKRPRSWNSPA